MYYGLSFILFIYMLNWGLGIEHEILMRFSNKLDIMDLKDPLVNKIYKQ